MITIVMIITIVIIINYYNIIVILISYNNSYNINNYCYNIIPCVMVQNNYQ